MSPEFLLFRVPLQRCNFVDSSWGGSPFESSKAPLQNLPGAYQKQEEEEREGSARHEHKRIELRPVYMGLRAS